MQRQSNYIQDEKSLVVRNESDFSIAPVGMQVLEYLRGSWGTYLHNKKVPLLDDNGMIFTLKDEDGRPVLDEQGNFVTATETIQEERPTPIKKRHQGVKAEDIYRFCAMVKDDQERESLHELIRHQKFDLTKAVQVYEKTQRVVVDRSIKPRTWKEADDLDTPTIRTVQKYKSQEKAIAVIYTILADFSSRFGRRSDLNEKGLMNLAEDILSEFPTFTVAELKMVCTLATDQDVQTGRKIFNLDYIQVMSIFREMYKERGDVEARKNYNEHLASKHDPFERTGGFRDLRQIKDKSKPPPSILTEEEIAIAKKYQK